MSKLSAASPTVAPKYLPLTAYYAALGAWRSRRADELRSTILVAGSPRSGTTWLGDVVAALAGRPLLHEPTHAHKVPEMRDGHGWDGRPFREADEPDPELAADLERLLTGRYLGPGLVPRSRAMDTALWARSPLVTKVIDVNLLLPWMARQLPWLQTVLVVRHPPRGGGLAGGPDRVQLVRSARAQPPVRAVHGRPPGVRGPHVVRDLGGEPGHDLGDRARVAARPGGRPRARRAGPLRGPPRRPGHRGPRLAADLGLAAPSPELVARLDRPSRAVNTRSTTLGKDAASGWRARFDGEERERLRAILERYGYPFYGPEGL